MAGLMSGVGLYALVAAVNLAVGACIGLTGIAGFLLPIFYVGALGLAPVEALALAFAAFVVSGVLGAPAYRSSGDLPARTTGWLAAGSLVGAVAGTLVGLVLPASVLTLLLYLVVLCSGVSVLVRMRPGKAGGAAACAGRQPARALLVVIGLLTALVCAATGAGGPVLVVPILMLLGIGPRVAVGMGLADSIAIAVPSTIGYFVGGSIAPDVWSLLVPALVGHAVGVLVGSRNAHRINQNVLKGIVAVGSVGIALWKLSGLLLG